MDKIKRLDIPLLGEGQYTEWLFKMVENMYEDTNAKGITREWLVLRILSNLIEAELEYSKVYEVFSTQNYMMDEHRETMEENLQKFEKKIGRFLLSLTHLLMEIGITSADILEYYKTMIKDNNLAVLQGGKEPLNLSLQVGHWENYIVSEVGWSLRGAFHVVPPADLITDTKRAYLGNKISNDSVYVMRIKQYDITVKLMEVFSITTEAKRNIKTMELWMAAFNFLNYMGATPVRLWNIIFDEYTNTINLMEKYAYNK